MHILNLIWITDEAWKKNQRSHPPQWDQVSYTLSSGGLPGPFSSHDNFSTCVDNALANQCKDNKMRKKININLAPFLNPQDWDDGGFSSKGSSGCKGKMMTSIFTWLKPFCIHRRQLHANINTSFSLSQIVYTNPLLYILCKELTWSRNQHDLNTQPKGMNNPGILAIIEEFFSLFFIESCIKNRKMKRSNRIWARRLYSTNPHACKRQLQLMQRVISDVHACLREITVGLHSQHWLGKGHILPSDIYNNI